jgi:glutathione reductase (NADPH)
MGTGRLADAHTVSVDDKQITAETILVANGGHPVMPDVPGIEHAISSNEAFHLEDLPRRVVVVGGGYIAVEFAGIFNGLGSDVIQLYRGEQILRGFDDDVRAMLAQEIRKKGIDLRVEADVTRIEKIGSHLKVTCKSGDVFEADTIMYATGRAPNTPGMGLEKVGIRLGPRGDVIVDEWSCTSVENIYAVGDITDRINLTPVALNEGLCFSETVFGNNPRKMDRRDVASAVFSQPNVSVVGLSEAAARQEYGEVDIYKSTFGSLKHSLTGRDEKTMMKLVVEAASQRVVGAHMVGPEAAEIIQGLAVGVKMGATKAQFDATVGIHPTAAEEFVTMREKFVEPDAVAAE